MIARIARKRCGFTFIDVAFSLVLTSILMTGVMTSVYIAGKSMPSPQSRSQSTMTAFQVVDQIATELESALYITQHTSTTLGYTVPDRNGDGIAERVLYSWSGTAGTPLTRQYNGSSAVSMAAGINAFSITPNYTTVTQSYPAVGVEDSAESLLVDDGTGASSTSNVTVQTLAQLGQYFSPTLPAGSVAWRPTRIQFMAKYNSNILAGGNLIQVGPTNVTSTPTTVLAQTTIANSALPISYAYQPFSFSGGTPYSSNAGFCFTIQPSSGLQSAIVQDTSSFTGELKTSLGSWSASSTRAVVSQLYGKLTRSSGYQYLNSKYVTSMGISIQLATTSPVQTTTCPTLNHPELLSNYWELKFDKNPTTIDVNGDGAGDWAINGGGTFNMNSLSNNVWQTSAVQLNTSTTSNFSTTTVVDLRFQNTSTSGNGAVFFMNALRSGSTCAPLQASLVLQSDGTQTLIISGKSDDSTVQPLITIPGLANQAIDLNLIVEPVTKAVCVSVNGAQYGTFALTRYASSDSRAYATIGTSSSSATYSYVRIRVLEQ